MKKKGNEKSKKKGRNKGKQKPDALKLILASLEALTAEVMKLAEDFEAFKLDPKRREAPAHRGTEDDKGPMGPQGPGAHRSQGAGKKKTRKKKTVAGKVVRKKVMTKKTAARKAVRKKTTAKKTATKKKAVTRKVSSN